MDDAAKAVPPGSLVRLCDPQGHYLATAFFNRHTLIAARVLTRVEAVAIDTGFLAPRLRHALAIRERRSEEHTSELPSLMRHTDAVFCCKKKKTQQHQNWY